MDFVDVRYAEKGKIATITLDRPDARNAYSEAMVESLVAAIDAAERNAAIRVIVVTGEGDTFSAGGDLKRMRDGAGMFAGEAAELRRRYVDGIQRVPRRLALADKPLVAAVNGHAIGAGLDLACMCDVRIVSSRAKLGSTFVKLGLVPGDGGAYLLARVVGLPRALDLMLTGRTIDADEALRIGLAQEVVPPDEVVATAMSYAERIAENAPIAVQLTKKAAYRSYGTDLETALEIAASYQGIAQTTADHREGVAALLEKRAPKFEGR